MTDGSRPGGIRVLVITLGRFGGVTQYGWLMSQALAERCSLAVVYSAGAQNRDRWSSLDVPLLEVKTFSSIPRMLFSMLSFRRFLRMRRFASEFRPDIVYYTGAHAWKPLLDLYLPRNAKTVLTVHDPDLHAGENSLLFRSHDALNRLRVDGYVLLNESQREGFIERYSLEPAAVTVVPLGILGDLPGEHRRLSQIDGLEVLEPLAGSYLLFLGRIRPYKGINTLLSAYRDLPALRDVPLVIAGSGAFPAAEQGLLSELTDRPVHVVNRWLSDEDISALVSSARWVVLPYTSATQSGVIPLASASGIPVISSDAGGLAEQVVEGVTGYLFAAGDVEALARALEKAAGISDAEYARMAAAARERAHHEWAWDALAQRLLAFFGSLLKAQRL